MNRVVLPLIVAAGVVSQSARAAIVIDTVLVGNPGNAADSTGFGAVDYTYRIGTTEVTNAQYADFLNNVDPTGVDTFDLYNNNMSSDIANGGINFNGGNPNGTKYSVKTGRGNNPVNYVSWYDAIRFANWLHNGQGSGNTESGAYTLLGGTINPSNGNSITRNPGALWALASEDEWYKAAYHKNDGATGNYWDYPTATDAEPYSNQPPGTGAPDASNTANFFKNDGIANGYNDGFAATGSTDPLTGSKVTDAGAYTTSISSYGTFDQGGNVWERNEALISGSLRGARGGSWNDDSTEMLATFRGSFIPSGNGAATIGFRVVAIPEPGSFLLVGLVALGCFALRKKLAA